MNGLEAPCNRSTRYNTCHMVYIVPVMLPVFCFHLLDVLNKMEVFT